MVALQVITTTSGIVAGEKGRRGEGERGRRGEGEKGGGVVSGF